MCFFITQCAAVVVRDRGIDMNLYIGRVLHQAVCRALIDRKVALLCLRTVVFLQFIYTLYYALLIPAGILAGLHTQVRVIRVQTQQFLRDLFFRHILDPEFDTLLPVFIIQIYRQFLTCRQFNLAHFFGQRVRPVDPGCPADTVQNFRTRRCCLYIGCISPERFARIISGYGPKLCFRIRKRSAVIYFRRARCPDGKRRRVHSQFSVYRLDLFEV